MADNVKQKRESILRRSTRSIASMSSLKSGLRKVTARLSKSELVAEKARAVEGKRVSRSFKPFEDETKLIILGSSPITVEEENLTLEKVVFIACGNRHAIALTSDGRPYGQGANDDGQLDSDGRADRYTNTMRQIPEPIFNNKRIVQAAVGLSHSVFLSDEGYVITYGQNEYGQLGHSRDREPFRVPPRMVTKLGREVAVQIACSENSTFILTSQGKVFSFGLGKYGILGLGDEGNRSDPKLIGGVLEGNPITQIAAGDNHVLALSVTGHTFAWGSNSSFQLGIEEKIEMSLVPMQVSLEKIIKTVAAGASHSLMLSVSGKIYGCGDNTHGQLALNENLVELPRKIHALSSIDKVYQIAAGSFHSMALMESGILYTLGKSGTNQAVSQETEHLHLISLPEDHGVFWMTGGRDASLILSSSNPALTYMESLPGTKLRKLSFKTLEKSSHQVRTWKLEAGKRASIKTFRRTLNLTVFDMYTLNASFLKPQLGNNSALDRIDVMRNSCIDIPSMMKGLDLFYNELVNALGKKQANLYLREQVAPLVAELDEGAPDMTQPDQLRVFLILMIMPFSNEVRKEYELLILSISRLPKESREKLFRWVKHDVPTTVFKENLVKPLLRLLDNLLLYHRLDESCEFFCKMLQQCFKINESRQKPSKNGHRPIEAVEFYSDQLALLRQEDLKRLFDKWNVSLQARADIAKRKANGEAIDGGLLARGTAFTLFDYPFLLSAEVKRKVLQAEYQELMVRTIFLSQIFQSSPYFVLEVRRESILEDTISKLSQTQEDDYRKPLKIKFAGEDGLDAGGIKKEFFQLLSAELFSPNYGMFQEIESDDGPRLWFRSDKEKEVSEVLKVNSLAEFQIVGTLIGLAIYNSTLIDVAFPDYFFRLLLGKVPKKPGLDELAELDPRYARQLRSLMDMDSDDIESLMLSFDVTVELFGKHVVHELKPGGSDIMVTGDNLEEYIDLICKWQLIDSIGGSATALVHGFNLVISRSLFSLSLFEPKELELAIVGSSELDFDDLEYVTTYEGGYSADHPTIRRFWKVAKSFSKEQKAQLMSFATGSPRAPVGGLKTTHFKIQRAGPDSERLISSSTCFNTLLLPDYGSTEKLKRKLEQSIEYNMGFGNE